MAETISGIEIVVWKKVDEAPTVQQVLEALDRFGFDPKLAEPPSVTTAFRRAIKAQAVSSETKSWCAGKVHLHGQLDEIIEESDGIRRQMIRHWKLDKESETVSGPDGLNLSIFQAQYETSDVSKIIRKILKDDGLGSYALNPGVYFVPLRNKDFLDRLENCCASFGFRMPRVEVPDSSAYKDELSIAISSGMSSEIEDHVEAVDAYTAETKAGIVRNRQEAMTMTSQLLEKLGAYIDSTRFGSLYEKLSNCRVRCAAQLKRIEDAVPAQRRRNIRGAAPEVQAQSVS